jgi:hypothetical protein
VAEAVEHCAAHALFYVTVSLEFWLRLVEAHLQQCDEAILREIIAVSDTAGVVRDGCRNATHRYLVQSNCLQRRHGAFQREWLPSGCALRRRPPRDGVI